LSGYEAATNAGTAIELPALLLGLLALGAGAYAAMLLFQVNGGRLLSRWMSLRAAAETERLGYFNRLVRLVEASYADNRRVQLLSLELFRRYQLGIQQVYYNHRGVQHRKSMDKTLRLGAVAAGILALGSGTVGIVGFFKPELLPLAAIGLLGSALSTVASRREELNQDERNSERYDRTADVLSHLREKHTEVQRALADGKLEVLAEYVAAVHEQLSLEHRQWLAQADNVSSRPAESNRQDVFALSRPI